MGSNAAPVPLCGLSAHHIFWFYYLIKLFARKESKIDGFFAQCCAIFMGSFRNFRCIVIANVRIEGRDKHQRLFKMLLNLLRISFDTRHAVIGEGLTGIRKQTNGVKDVKNNEGFKDIQFKMAASPPTVTATLFPIT